VRVQLVKIVEDFRREAEGTPTHTSFGLSQTLRTVLSYRLRADIRRDVGQLRGKGVSVIRT
jgi:hypothetical protein